MKRLSVLMAVAFVDMMGLMIIWPLLPLYANNLGASATVVGLLAASFPVAQLVASPVWGYVSDRYGRRPALLVGLGASAFAYVVFGFAHTVWLLFVSRFVQGLGGGTTGVVQAYVADAMLPRERAKALGWLSAATSAGVIIGPAIGSFMHRFGEAAPGLFASALVLVNVAFAWKWLPESRWAQAGVTRTGVERPRASVTLGDAVRNIVQPAVRVVADPTRPVSLLIWIYALAMLAFNALPPIFSLYLHDRFAITADQIGFFFCRRVDAHRTGGLVQRQAWRSPDDAGRDTAAARGIHSRAARAHADAVRVRADPLAARHRVALSRELGARQPSRASR